jgi:hypothetical protein
MSGADASGPQPPHDVVAYCSRGLEDERLQQGTSRLERWRTQELLSAIGNKQHTLEKR